MLGRLAQDSAPRPGPEVREKKPRRRFTAAYKLRILKEFDACTQQQAATMEETSATAEQLVPNINQNATNTQRADSLSKGAVAVEGKKENALKFGR